ncbi:hypothetical protein HYV70_02425 [Candidatus Uhrbacteria bacterium]|nr:hypothetical protein [Candidatus Uhrbacteria bacterium]
MRKDLKEEFESLIKEGYEITRIADEGLEQHSATATLIHEIHHKFIMWKQSAKDLLKDEAKNEELDIGFLFEGDGVPLIKAGPEYSDPMSERSQKLFTNIRIAASSHLRKIKEIYEEVEKNFKIKKSFIVRIKNISLSKEDCLLKINDGEKIIFFKSKKGKEDFEKETKQFKILYHLWEFRQEKKGSSILKKSEIVTLKNLQICSQSKSASAVSKTIERLNKRFKKEGVTIEIECENEKCRLIIEKT